MKTVFFAASAALSLGIGSAYADGGGQAQTTFTRIQDQQLKAPAQPAAAQNADEVTRNYLTRSHRNTSMFPANQNEGGNN